MTIGGRKMKMSLQVASFALVLSIASGCAHDRFAEFRQYEREANGRFLGVLGFALDVPGVDRFEERFSYREDVLVIPGTGDTFLDQSELDYNRRAVEFAERYNKRLLRKKKPIQSATDQRP
jgi:hypothetical protein